MKRRSFLASLAALVAAPRALLAMFRPTPHPREFVTIRDGLWNDPAAWADGVVPDTTANVVLHHTITIPSGAHVVLGERPNLYSQHGVVTSGYSRVTDLDETWTPAKAYYADDDRVIYNGASYRIPSAPYIVPRWR